MVMVQQVSIVLLTTQRSVLLVTTDFIYQAILAFKTNALAQTEMAQQASHAQPTMPQCVQPAVPDSIYSAMLASKINAPARMVTEQLVVHAPLTILKRAVRVTPVTICQEVPVA